MAETKVPAKTKVFKFPKSMGACADKLHEIREKRLAAQKVAEAIEAEEKALIEHIINNLSSKEDTGAAGKSFRVQVLPKEIPQVKDWSKFYAYVLKHKAFELLQRRLGETAVFERLGEKNAKGEYKGKIPGVDIFKTKKVSLTKVK